MYDWIKCNAINGFIEFCLYFCVLKIFSYKVLEKYCHNCHKSIILNGSNTFSVTVGVFHTVTVFAKTHESVGRQRIQRDSITVTILLDV